MPVSSAADEGCKNFSWRANKVTISSKRPAPENPGVTGVTQKILHKAFGVHGGHMDMSYSYTNTWI